uniref:Uncharacterized protein n=1 Tax=Rousettus aegyptiacus TaxID=9407 RepID=A0A7J8KBD4_ROUAE|nr:hypothetical protein HJG63_007960 [Rousettus aegyptiacus]
MNLGFEDCVGIYPLEGEWKYRNSRVKNGLIQFSPSKWLHRFGHGRIKYSLNLDSQTSQPSSTKGIVFFRALFFPTSLHIHFLLHERPRSPKPDLGITHNPLSPQSLASQTLSSVLFLISHVLTSIL